MKKIFGFIMTLIMCSFICANAQAKFTNSIGDNWFAGVNIGTIAPVSHSFDWAQCGLDNYRFEWGVEVGKWITPVIGLAVSDELQVNTTYAKTAFDVNVLSGDLHVNLSNLISGYKGEPRTWEFEAIPSIGWMHFYTISDMYGHCNFVTYRFALSANYNFGADKEWTAYIRPGIQYMDRFRDYNGQFDLRLGVVYKFKGSKSKSHNYVLNKYAVTQEAYDAVVAERDAALNKAPEVRVEKVDVIKEVYVNVPAFAPSVVNFAFNSDALSDDAKVVLDAIPTNSVVDIDAYASAHGGTDAINKIVSDKRANAVKEYLVSRGVTINNVVSHGAENEYSGQVAIVTIK